MGANEADAVLRLPPVLDLCAAAPLRQELMLLKGRGVELDGSAVQRLGGPCLQVLLSAARTWAAEARSFRLAAASPPLVEALALFGATSAFAATPPGARS